MPTPRCCRQRRSGACRRRLPRAAVGSPRRAVDAAPRTDAAAASPPPRRATPPAQPRPPRQPHASRRRAPARATDDGARARALLEGGAAPAPRPRRASSCRSAPTATPPRCARRASRSRGSASRPTPRSSRPTAGKRTRVRIGPFASRERGRRRGAPGSRAPACRPPSWRCDGRCPSCRWVDWPLLAVLAASVRARLRARAASSSACRWPAGSWPGSRRSGLAPQLAPQLPLGSAGLGAATRRRLRAVSSCWRSWSGRLLARLVRMLIHATPLSLLDRVLGAGFGVCCAAWCCCWRWRPWSR